MIRHLFTAISVLSLSLCLATGVLWVRSYFASDWIKHLWVETTPGVRSFRASGSQFRGTLNFDLRYQRAWIAQPFGAKDLNYIRATVLHDRDLVNGSGVWVVRPFSQSYPIWVASPRWRFWYYPVEGNSGKAWTLVMSVPHWFVTLLFALGTVPSAILHWPRRMKNCCPTCGYNLTGNVSGVCPECGTRIEHKAGAGA